MKRAIVIGASSGIGFEVARLLLKDGWKVGVAARRMDLLQNIGYVDAAERIDVNDPQASEQLRGLISDLGGMDLFFYASGIGKQNRTLEEDIEIQTATTNGVGFTRMIGEAYRYFAEKGEGHIVAITSIAGTKGLGPAPAYSATKAMQNVYLQALEQQAITRGLNIYFTDIRPGFVDTALLSGGNHYPMMMKPEDVAQDIMSAIKHKKHICVINWKFRLLTMLWRRIPRFIWRRMRFSIVLMLVMRWDFKKHVFDGKTYYSYHAPDYKFADKAVTGYDPGMRILMDEHYNPVDTIHALQSLDGYLPEGSPLDGHDFYFYSPTHWIASASYVERQAGDSIRAVAYLQEVENGEVVFDWWSTSHPILLKWVSPTFNTSYDYVHFNSIDVLPDKNWLVSFRALSTIVKIDRQGDGGILWHIRGEDSTLPENKQFSGQHYVRWHQDTAGDYITVFDNGNARDPGYTHLLRLDVEDHGTKVVYNDAKDLVKNKSNYFTQACGALVDFGTQGFVAGWGWSTSPKNCSRLVTEYDANGIEVFSLSRDDNDPNSVNPSYRCVKCQ